MVRGAIRLFVKPWSIITIDVLILLPILLSIVTIVGDLLAGKLDEPMEILEGVGVVLIGWGVAIEERPSLREIFFLRGGDREEIEVGIDTLCHSSGIGLLIFGLFAEIAVTAVRLPNHIIPTEGFDPVVLCFSTLLVAVGSYILAHHIVRMVLATVWGNIPVPHDGEH